MRIAIILMILGILQARANDAYSQKTMVSINFSETELVKVLDKIEDESEFFFLYNEKLLDTDRKVSIDAKDQLISVILDKLFTGTDVKYTIIDRKIILAPDYLTKETDAATIMQQKVVSGTVTDASNGEGMAGVNIQVKGTTIGTISDVKGKYSIPSAVDQNSVLVFSFIGYVTQEVSVSGKTVINVALTSVLTGLDEVVVVGYGTVKRGDITGSISSINSRNFNMGLTVAPEQLMQGKVTGVNIIQNSGQPGAASTVRIRGSSSVSAGNEPLYVVDGVPLQFGTANLFVNVAGEAGSSPFSSEGSNPLNALNPSDIESIEILKDASATAIYGSRGANGVIIITTKSKNMGETINFDTYFGASTIRKKLVVLSASEYRDKANSMSLPFPDGDANTDWQDEIFRTGLSQNHNLSFGGGSATSSYRASFGYSAQDGIIISSGIEKYTARLNAFQTGMEGKLKVGIHLSYGKILNDNAPISSNIGNEGGNILKDAIRWAPTLPVRNADGSFYQIGELRVNPVSWGEEIDDLLNTSFFLGNINLSYNILKELNLTVNMGQNDEAVNRYTSVPSSHPIGAAEGGRASISKFQNSSSLIETNLTFNKELSNNSSLTVLAGYSFQRFTNENTYTSANKFVSTSVKWNLMQSGSMVSNTSYKSANRLISMYTRINYTLMDRYLFTFTLRNDGSSRFGGNNQYGLFPSGAFGWKISDEPFFSIETISSMKLRLGYGVTGNQEIPNDLFREQLSISGSSVYSLGGVSVPSVLPSNYPNPDLKWETTSQFNIGLDYGILKDRLTGSFDYYKKHTSDLLLQFSTAAPSVVSSQWANVGELENNGFEIALDAKIIKKEAFQWNANLNFSTNKNEVISLSNEKFSRSQILTNATSGVVAQGFSTQIIKPGLELGTFWGRKFTGLDADGKETFLDEDGVAGADMVVIGSANPNFTFGITNNLFWSKFDLSVTLRGTVGNQIYNNTAAEFSYVNSFPGVNILRSALDLGMSRSQISQFSSQWIQDGSFLRLDNVSLGYTFDTDKISFLSRARVYVTGQNLFVITKYPGFDPEVRTNTNKGGIAPIGIDYLSYPRPRILLIGASLAF